MARSSAPQGESETDVRGRRLPPAGLCPLRVQLVGLLACPVASRELEHGGREDPVAIECTATAEHLGEAVHVRDGGSDADPGHLRVLLLEGSIRAQIAMALVPDRIVAAKIRHDVPGLQVRAQPDGGVAHLQRCQDLLFHERAVAALLGIGAAQCLGHEDMIHQRGIGDAPTRLLRRLNHFAHRRDDFIETVDVPARLHFENDRQSGHMREEMKHGDALPGGAGEGRDQLADGRSEGELATFDRAQHQDVGEGLGDRENAEYRARLQRQGGVGVRRADGGLQAHAAGAGDHDDRTVVQLCRDVRPNHLLEVLQAVLIQNRVRHAVSPVSAALGGRLPRARSDCFRYGVADKRSQKGQIATLNQPRLQ